MNAAARERRYAVVALMMLTWPRTPTGKLRRGFWEMAADEIERIEGRLLTAFHRGDSLAVWWGQYDRALQLHANGDATMPVWLPPQGGKKVKQAAFVVYLRAMYERCKVSAQGATTDDYYAQCVARADVYALVADQLEKII